ncbi:hypothetical protein LCGC14_1479830 [marine sediment metagenome]|uniref:Uncharacterized protein n=1 Tax=marine sediment metagenome TaxID=412755 RepID=A0A0F9JAG7_9ZZZZ
MVEDFALDFEVKRRVGGDDLAGATPLVEDSEGNFVPESQFTLGGTDDLANAVPIHANSITLDNPELMIEPLNDKLEDKKK